VVETHQVLEYLALEVVAQVNQVAQVEEEQEAQVCQDKVVAQEHQAKAIVEVQVAQTDKTVAVAEKVAQVKTLTDGKDMMEVMEVLLQHGLSMAQPMQEVEVEVHFIARLGVSEVHQHMEEQAHKVGKQVDNQHQLIQVEVVVEHGMVAQEMVVQELLY